MRNRRQPQKQKTKTQKDHENITRDDFCLFRLPEDSKRVLWEITHSCNYSCPYCIFAACLGKIAGELTTEECCTLLEDLKGKGFTHIKYTGGEPFLRKDMIDILKKTRELGLRSDISTNASCITVEKAEALKDYTDMVHVSLDGHVQYIHESARGPHTYEPTIRGIRRLTGAGNYVRIGTVIFKDNDTHLEETVEKAKELGAKEIIFSYMEPAGRMKDDYTMVSRRPVSELKAELDILKERYARQIKVNYAFSESNNPSKTKEAPTTPDDISDTEKKCKGTCPGCSRFIYLNNLGQVSPCTWITENHPEYKSDISCKDHTLDEVLQSGPIRRFREYIHQYEGKGCPIQHIKNQ